jgi:hypothetical protein
MDSESFNHYRGRKTGGRGRHEAEEAEAVPFQADVLVALPIDKGIANRAHYLCTPEAR